MPTVELTWRSPKVLIAKVDGRDLYLTGSESTEGDVHYYISSRLITRWADGEPLDPDERDSILPEVVAAGRQRGWNFVIELLAGDANLTPTSWLTQTMTTDAWEPSRRRSHTGRPSASASTARQVYDTARQVDVDHLKTWMARTVTAKALDQVFDLLPPACPKARLRRASRRCGFGEVFA